MKNKAESLPVSTATAIAGHQNSETIFSVIAVGRFGNQAEQCVQEATCETHAPERGRSASECLRELTYLRPLFVVAMVLSWNAILFAIDASPSPELGTASVAVLAACNLALAILAGCAKRSGLARELVVRADADLSQVRAVLWIITFFSLSFAVFGVSAAWRLSHPQ